MMPSAPRQFELAAWWTLLLALLMGTSHGMAATPAVLVGVDLRPQAGHIQSVRAGVVSYFDEGRRYTTAPLTDWLELHGFPAEPLAEGETLPPARIQRLVLTDGQVLIGEWEADKEQAAGQTLVWRHGVLGPVTVNLEQVRSWQRGVEPLPPLTDAGSDDVVELTNGDRVRGFVSQVSFTHVQVQLAGGQTVTLERQHVRALRLANPTTTANHTSHLVWLRDGSRWRCDDLTLAEDRLTLERPHLARKDTRPLEVPATRVQRVELASPHWRLMDLADLPAQGGAAEVFGALYPLRLSTDGVHLHAPTQVTWTLPPGTQRIAFTALLDLDAQTLGQRVQWANLQVRVRVDDQEAAVVTLDQRAPHATVNIAAAGARLSVTVDSGRNGPLLDRLLLRDALVLGAVK